MFNMLGDPGYTQQALNIVKTHRKKPFCANIVVYQNITF